MSEKRPVDRVGEAVSITAEAAELAEHIQETDPHYQRELLINTLIEMIDNAHTECFEASVEMEQ